MNVSFLTLLICSLATYRLAVMLSIDSGPWRFISKFRAMLKREAKQHPAIKKSDVHHGVECLRCSSVHVAVPVGLFAYYRDSLPGWLVAAGDIFLLCLAFSAAAILFNRILPPK